MMGHSLTTLPYLQPPPQQQRRRRSTRAHKQQQLKTNLKVSVCTAQGFRSYQEDDYLVGQNFAAVFDGHGGKAVSRYLRQNLLAHLQASLPQVMAQKRQQQQQQQQQQHQNEKEDEIWGKMGSTEPDSGIASEPTVEDYCVALRMALHKVDREVQRINHWSYQGSTAVAAWLHYNTTTTTSASSNSVEVSSSSSEENSSETGAATPESQSTTSTTTTLIVANIGDSRAIYGRNGTALPLTRDHKPDDPLEKERIEAQGGRVVWCGGRLANGQPDLTRGVYRVNGNLALSRAIGDRSERPAVTADPDITYVEVLQQQQSTITDQDDTVGDSDDPQSPPQAPKNQKEYLVLATDGLWDVFTNQDVVDIVDALLEKTSSPALKHQRSKIADALVRESIRRGTFDNVTVIIIWLNTGDGEQPSDSSEDGMTEE